MPLMENIKAITCTETTSPNYPLGTSLGGSAYHRPGTRVLWTRH